MSHLPWSEKTLETVRQYRREDLSAGPIDEHFRILLETSPDFGMMTEEYLVGTVMARPGLPMRERSIIIMAALLVHRFVMVTYGHMRWALNIGITRQEVLEILIRVGSCTGWPAGTEIFELFEKAYPGYLKTISENPLGKVRSQPQLSLRERALIDMAVSIAQKLFDRLRGNMLDALDIGITKEEILEVIIQATPFTGWQVGIEALLVAKGVFGTKN